MHKTHKRVTYEYFVHFVVRVLGLEVQDEVDDADDRQHNLNGNIKFADTGMALLDLRSGFEHVIFIVFSHQEPPKKI